MAKCSQHQKDMAESYTTPVLVRHVIDGDYMLQDFGSEFDALCLPRGDFDELCSSKTEASLDVPPKSWCIVVVPVKSWFSSTYVPVGLD